MILVNGCSFSQGETAWPHHLQTFKQNHVVNLSCSSAGNTYIHESTVSELSQRSYQAVLIMWSGLSRIDVKVNDPDKFKNSWYNSQFAAKHNDWPKKIIYPSNDRAHIDQEWVFGLGEQNRDPIVVQNGLFTGLYKHLDLPQFIFHFLIKMISLQNTLKVMGLPYCFMFYQPYQKDLQIFPMLCKLVDWNNVYLEKNIYEMALANNDVDSTNHPGAKTHLEWAGVVDQIIMNKLLKEQYA